MEGEPDINKTNEADGLRLTWQYWPSTRIEATKCVVPFAALYTPLKPQEHPPVEYHPISCKSCGAFLNPYAQRDLASGFWACPFCLTRNGFPPGYQGLTEENPPAELQYQTLEYRPPENKQPAQPPAYIFVVDTSGEEGELGHCTSALLQALSNIPDYAQIGLVTYGTHVAVHELGFQECPKAYIFKGSGQYTRQQIAEQLGLGTKAGPGARKGGPAAVQLRPGGAGRFIVPLAECEFQVNNILEQLQKDAFPAIAEHRPARCTGTAVQVAAGLAGASLLPGQGAGRIMLFVGGPSTEGNGKVVERELSEPIRSHKDLAKDGAPHFVKARKFFDELADQLSRQGHAFDVFTCALDQVGLAEMKPAVEASGGMVVLTDSFESSVFRDSLRRIFPPEGEAGLTTCSTATLEVHASRGVKVQGLLGPASRSEGKKTSLVADQPMGLGGTTSWKFASLDATTTVCVFYDIVGGAGKETPAGDALHLQFVTRYLSPLGQWTTRVFTCARGWVPLDKDANAQSLLAGFDQEAAAVVLARVATFKMETEDDFDATRWLDRTLIRAASRFGGYRKDDPDSFQLMDPIAFFPQFLFNLRRSQFVQVFGNSPDETAFHRLQLGRECVDEAIVMLQPSLIVYALTQDPENPVSCGPVMLDVSSIDAQTVLVLDSYFHVVLFHGSAVAAWRKAGYHEQAEFTGIKLLLEWSRQEAEGTVLRRFPVPKLVDCDQNGSQARFLLTKLNPSSTYMSDSMAAGEVIMTDDVSLQVFTDHLKKLAVQS